MAVCPKCKAENDAHRIRCGQCGQNISKRGEFSKSQGPQVVVLGSVEDLRRARETGEIDSSEDDPSALGWLESPDLDRATRLPPDSTPGSGTRRVSVREIDKITGLHNLRSLQEALLSEPDKGSPPKPPERPPSGRDPGRFDPARIEPVKTDTGRVDLRKAESGKWDVGRPDSGKTEPVKTDTGRVDLRKGESGKWDLGKPDPGKAEPSRTEPGRTEPGRTEPGKTESARIDPARVERARESSESARMGRDGSGSRKGYSDKPAALDKPPEKPAPGAEKPARLEAAPGKPESPTGDETAPAVAAYLAGELFPEPFALSFERRYLMGRDLRASIYLPSPEVSRRHAGIAADVKGDFWIEDLRSSNGTYVNGFAIVKRRLKPNDRIDLGPFVFRFVLATPGEAPPRSQCDSNEDTRTMRVVQGVLSGDIGQNGVVPIILLLHTTKRSGVLTLRAGKQVGRIFLMDGEIHHAQFGKILGEDALASLLPAEAGTLHFADEKVQVKRTITRPTQQILSG